MHWQCRKKRLAIGKQPLIMGILNATPDSFSDGGCFLTSDAAIQRGLEMHAQGADIIDIGGESTRPGAEPVDAATEQQRVIPIIEALVKTTPNITISIDTTKASVAAAAIEAGAVIINDVTALQGDPDMPHVACDTGAGVVLMHMRGTPCTMQDHPEYGNVVNEICDWLRDRLSDAERVGIKRTSLVVDPGIGFGKTTMHNIELIANLKPFKQLERPLLVGLSRKRFIGELTGVETARDRLAGSLAGLSAAILNGAAILRVHDVPESAQAARVAAALRDGCFTNGFAQGGLTA